MLAASARGCVNVVSSLLATGTEANYTENGGESALFVALEHGHFQVSLVAFGYKCKWKCLHVARVGGGGLR